MGAQRPVQIWLATQNPQNIFIDNGSFIKYIINIKMGYFDSLLRWEG